MDKLKRLFDKYGIVQIEHATCMNKHGVVHTYFDPDDYSDSYLYIIDAWFPIMTKSQYDEFCDVATRYTGTRFMLTKIGKVCPINPLTILMRGI